MIADELQKITRHDLCHTCSEVVLEKNFMYGKVMCRPCFDAEQKRLDALFIEVRKGE
jgi:formylmethanofuran dehydrogenase subunit E